MVLPARGSRHSACRRGIEVDERREGLPLDTRLDLAAAGRTGNPPGRVTAGFVPVAADLAIAVLDVAEQIEL